MRLSSVSAALALFALAACHDISGPPAPTGLRPVVSGRSSVVTPGGVTYAIVDLVGLGGDQAAVQMLNASGQAGGWSSVPGNFSYGAFRWTSGTITPLGTLGGAHSYPFDMNAAGDMTGWAELPGGTSYHAVLWRGEAVTDLGVFSGHTHSVGIAINDAGQVIGESSGPSGPPTKAFIWQNGVRTELPPLPLPRRGASPTGINSSGDVVGQSGLGLIGGPPRAVLWRNGTVTDLGTLGGNASWASGINDAGQIFGVVEYSPFSYHAFLWENGVMTDLGGLDGGSSMGVDMNSHGHVVGYAFLANGYPTAVLWRGGEIIDLGALPGGTYSQALAINDNGLVVGISENAEGRFHAVLWENGTIVDLGTLGGFTSSIGGRYSLNEAGHIGGSAENAAGELRPVVWVPSDPVQTVMIDVKPGSATNPINVRSNGVVPVAVLSTADFDATSVDVTSLRFGPGGAPESHARGHVEDVNVDGRADLLLHFDVAASGIPCGASAVTLNGRAGTVAITGTDAIVTTGCR